MVTVPREVRRDVVEEIKWSLARHTVTLDFSQRALHLRRARNIDAPASILFPRRRLFGLLWEPLPYLNVYSSVTPDDG